MHFGVVLTHIHTPGTMGGADAGRGLRMPSRISVPLGIGPALPRPCLQASSTLRSIPADWFALLDLNGATENVSFF